MLSESEIDNLFSVFSLSLTAGEKAVFKTRYLSYLSQLNDVAEFKALAASLQRWFCASVLRLILHEMDTPEITPDLFNIASLIEHRRDLTEWLVTSENLLFHLDEDDLSIATMALQREILMCNIDAVGFGGIQKDQPQLNRAALKSLAINIMSYVKILDDSTFIETKHICAAAILCQRKHIFADGNHRTGMYLYYHLHLEYSKKLPLMEPHILHGFLTIHKCFTGRHMGQDLPKHIDPDRLEKHTKTKSLYDIAVKKCNALAHIAPDNDLIAEMMANLLMTEAARIRQKIDNLQTTLSEYAKLTQAVRQPLPRGIVRQINAWRAARLNNSSSVCEDWSKAEFAEIKIFEKSSEPFVFVPERTSKVIEKTKNKIRREGGVGIVVAPKQHFVRLIQLKAKITHSPFPLDPNLQAVDAALPQVDPGFESAACAPIRAVLNNVTNPSSLHIKETKIYSHHRGLWAPIQRVLQASKLKQRDVEAENIILDATGPHPEVPSGKEWNRRGGFRGTS